jgi:predicted GNAT family N-acyltransferase
MDKVIKRPSEVTENEMKQIVELVMDGGQIQGNSAVLKSRLDSSEYISFIKDEDKIVSTATLKNPVDSYRKKVFKSANVESLEKVYKYELGYIVTVKDREGEKLCQSLLTTIYPIISEYKMFATTRKESVKHILGKFGFKIAGNNYNEDLSLLIN